MKKLAVFRIGSAELLTADAAALVPFVEEGRFPLMGTSVGFGYVSLIFSHAGPSEITQAYQEVEKRLDDTLPLIVVDLESRDASIWIPSDCLLNWHELHRQFLAECAELETGAAGPTQIELTLDQLLDLANERGGVDRLTPAELELLQKLSAE